jgi:hypothetical protein
MIPALKTIKKDVENKVGLNLSRNTRKKEYVLSRYIYMVIANKFTCYTLEQIGMEVGRDHATVIYALNILEDALKYEPKYGERLRRIYDELEGEYLDKYSPQKRAPQDMKFKKQLRQRKNIFRIINQLSVQQLSELEHQLLKLSV